MPLRLAPRWGVRGGRPARGARVADQQPLGPLLVTTSGQCSFLCISACCPSITGNPTRPTSYNKQPAASIKNDLLNWASYTINIKIVCRRQSFFASFFSRKKAKPTRPTTTDSRGPPLRPKITRWSRFHALPQLTFAQPQQVPLQIGPPPT